MADAITFSAGISINDRQLLRDMERAGRSGGQSFNKGFSNNAALALGRITGKANEFQKSLEASNARVIAFGASAGAIYAIKSAFEKLVGSTIQVEKQLTEVNSILQLGGDSLQKFSNDLFAVANRTGTAFEDAAKAATELSRQGLSVEETLKRTAAALSLARLSGTDVGTAVSSLTAILNSFTNEALDSETVINRLTAVDAKYAISTDDLAKALSRVSASANDANVSFNETIGLITAAQQITARGGSVIGNALKSIFTRLQRPQVIDDLEAAGVQVRNLQGHLLPMVSILRNVSSAYDTLSSSQKSFVAETVGGVYQVNILKAVLKDVGAGASVFDGAMAAAADSSGTADRRLKALNNTIASSLLRTMNELTRAASNVGQSLVGPGLKSGVGGFEKILHNIADIADSNAKTQGSAFAQAGSTLFQGGIKSLSNIIQGPGIQLLVYTFTKLVSKLGDFAIKSVKDLDNVNNKEKERLDLNASLTGFLATQKELYEGIIAGTITAEEVMAKYYETISASVNKLESLKNLGNSLGGIVQAEGKVTVNTVGSGAATGYIPNVSSEIEGARNGGYRAGSVVKTIVNGGNTGTPIIVNTAETKSSFITGKTGSARTYDFINPPKNSSAGKKHQASAIRKTGIDPYALPQTSVMAKSYIPKASKGHIPNLSIADIESKFRDIGLTDWKTELHSGVQYPKVPAFELDWLPESFLQAAVKHFSTPKDITSLLNFAQNKIYDTYLTIRKTQTLTGSKSEQMKYAADTLEDSFWHNAEKAEGNEGLWGALRSSTIRQDDKSLSFLKKGGKNQVHKENLANFISSILGKPFDPPSADTDDKEEDISLDPATIKALLSRYSKTLPTVAAYNDIGDLTVPKNQPDFISKVRAGNESYSFNTPIFGHKTFIGQHLGEAKNLASIQARGRAYPPHVLGNQLGGLFDLRLKQNAEDSGAILPKANSILDLPFPFKGLLQDTDITGDVSGIELKSSLVEAIKNSGSKVFRSLIGEPSGSKLLGPVEAPYHLAGAPESQPGKKTGILDYAVYGGSSRNQMFASAIKELAQGKALSIVHAPSLETLGAMRAKSEQLAGGKNYITNPEDFANYDQLIYNSSVRTQKGVESGPTGLMFALASQIHGIDLPKTGLESQLKGHQELREIIKRRVGSRYVGASKGFIPNLSIYDSFSQMQELVDNQKVYTYVSDKAKKYAYTPPGDLKNKFNSNLDKEFFASALTHGVLGKPFEKDLEILKKTCGISDSLFEVVLEDFSQKVNLPELQKRVKLNEFSGGLIPNLAFNKNDTIDSELMKKALGAMKHFGKGFDGEKILLPPVTDALKRENQATQGHAILSSSPLLKSASNPAGLAAIDRRSQPDADTAIAQHQALGQSMSQIRAMRTEASGGLIPNLAVGDSDGFFSGNSIFNSTILAISAFGTQSLVASQFLDKFKLKLGSVISAQERTEINIRKLNSEYQKAQEEIVVKGHTQFQDQTYKQKEGGISQLTTDFKAKIASLDTNEQKSYRQSREQEAARTRSLGNRIAFGSGAVGGIVSTTAGRFSPTAQAAIDEFTIGLQLAGQVLSAFPNSVGKALAVGTAAAAGASAINVAFQGLAKARKDYDVSQNKFQKLSSQIDTVVVALNNYDNLLSDSSVSLEAVVRESRKFNETLAELGQTTEGRQAVQKISGAPDIASQSKLLLTYKESQARDLDRQASLLNIQEYAGKKTFLGLGNPFGFSNDVEKNEITQLTRNATSSGISSLTDTQKTNLLKVSDNPEAFQNAVDNMSGDFKDFLNSLEKILGSNNVSIVVDAIRKNLSTEKSYTSPSAVKQLSGLQERNASRQLSLDSAIRSETSVKRLFANQGSLQAQNFLDVRGIQRQNQFNESSVQDARRKAEQGVNQLRFGDITNREYETGGELNRIEAERSNKVDIVNNQTSRQISEMLSQSFEDYIKRTDSSKFLGAAGETNINQVAPNNLKLVGALNQGIARTVGRGDLSRFEKNGSIDLKALIDEIKTSGSANLSVQQSISDYLQSQNSKEILEVIRNANLELVTINQEANTEAAKQTAALKGFRKEADFKELSNFMGGVRNLLDRNSRRSSEREAIHNTSLLRNGTTPEIRGIGGAGLLDYFKKQNVPLDLSGKSDLSRLMIEAWKAASKGIADTQKQSLSRIVGSSTRLNGPNDVTTKGLKDFGNVNFLKTAQAALEAEYRPENPNLTQQGKNEVSTNTLLFNKALDTSSMSVYNFANALNKSARDVIEASANTIKVRQEVDKATKKDKDSLPINREQYKRSLKEQQALIAGEETGPKPSISVASYAPTAIGAIGAIGTFGSIIAQAVLSRGIVKAIKQQGGSANKVPEIVRPEITSSKIKPTSTRKLSSSERNIIRENFKAAQEATEIQQREKSSNKILSATERSNTRGLSQYQRNILAQRIRSRRAIVSAQNKTFSGYQELPYRLEPNTSPTRTVVLPQTPNDIQKIMRREQKRLATRPVNQPRTRQPRVEVPYTPAETRVPYTVEIRQKGIQTISEVQKLYGIKNRGEARQRLYEAYPERRTQNITRNAPRSSPINEPITTRPAPLRGPGGRFVARSTSSAPSPAKRPFKRSTGGQILGLSAGGVSPTSIAGFGGAGGSILGETSSLALSYGLQSLGANVGGKTGTALMYGSLLAPQIASSLGGSVAPLLAKGAFGLGAGGSLGSLGALGVGGALGVAGLSAATAYGGFKVGQGIYNKATGYGKLSEDFGLAQDETSRKRLEFVQKKLGKGASVSSIRNELLKDIESNESSIKTAGGGGVYSSLTNQSKITDSLKKSNDDIRELINHLADLKDQADAQKHDKEMEAKQEALVAKQEELIDAQIAFFKGGNKETGSSNATANIQIDISIKDADKIPDILMEKLITPLKKQLGDLQTTTNILVNKESPQPAKV